ncbi:MAG: class IV adenylate cyclase [Candidatus Gracilibacteria bacterium]
MQEIEAKILGINPVELESKLTAIGAQRIIKRTMKNTFFENTEGIFLRLRQDGDRYILTRKIMTVSENIGIKSAQELETDVSDPAALIQILESIGFSEGRTLSKIRTTYTLGDNIHIEIDEYPNIPPLLEIEAPSEDIILSLAKQLGYTQSDLSSLSTLGLEEHYGVTLQETNR